MLKILIFIPAKNEQEAIAGVIANSLTALRSLDSSLSPEVLVIDDGSTDQTTAIATAARAKVFRHQESVGLGNIFSQAVKYAVDNDFDILLTIDGDGQFATTEIPELIKPIIAGEIDFATGSRFITGAKVSGIPKAKLWGNWLMSKVISRILNRRYWDVSCGFRAYNREALLQLNLFGGFTYTQEVFLNLGFKKLRIKEIPVSVIYFPNRQSRIAGNLWRYGWQTLVIIFKSVIYYRPMRLFGQFSFFLLVISTPILVVLGVRYYLTDLISPHKGLAILALSLVGLSFASFVTGILLQILGKLQLGIDQVLYYEKKRS